MNNYEIETEEYLKHGIRLFQSGLFGRDETSHAAEYCRLTDPKGFIIDMGCGIGEMGALIKYIRPTTNTINVTNCTYQANYMAQLGRKVVLSDFSNTPLDSGVADFVMFNESFGYGDVNSLIKEAGRLLKTNGKLVIKDFRHINNLTTVVYEPTWEYSIYPPQEVINVAAENNLALEFYIHPNFYDDKFIEFLNKSKMAEWHNINFRETEIVLYRFVKL